MHTIDTILLNENGLIEVISKTSDPIGINIVKQYYSWNNIERNWNYKSKELASVHGFSSEAKLRSFCCENSDVIWSKGICKNANLPSCEGEIRISARKRGELYSILEKKKDFRLIDVYIPDENGKWHSASDAPKDEFSNLCTVCLNEKINHIEEQAELARDEVNKREREKREIIEAQNQQNHIEALEIIKNRLPKPLSYYPTGFSALDKLLNGGFKKNALNIFAGNPLPEIYSCFLSSINYVAGTGTECVFMSFSRIKDVMESELIANKAGIPVHALDNPEELQRYEVINVKKAIDEPATVKLMAPLHRTMDDIEQIIEGFYKEGIRVFFIEALQNLLIGKLDSSHTNNAEQVFTANCNRLNDIIREKSITIIAISLMNNNIDRRDADFKFKKPELRIPKLGDLRYGNALTQLAHNIIFLHRPGYYPIDTDATSAQFFVRKSGNKTDCGSCEISYNTETGFYTEFKYQSDNSHEFLFGGMNRRYKYFEEGNSQF